MGRDEKWCGEWDTRHTTGFVRNVSGLVRILVLRFLHSFRDKRLSAEE